MKQNVVSLLAGIVIGYKGVSILTHTVYLVIVIALSVGLYLK